MTRLLPCGDSFWLPPLQTGGKKCSFLCSCVFTQTHEADQIPAIEPGFLLPASPWCLGFPARSRHRAGVSRHLFLVADSRLA
nr:MAG TPA_asm: hypothetical protein [Caudoviricetes sp.]